MARARLILTAADIESRLARLERHVGIPRQWPSERPVSDAGDVRSVIDARRLRERLFGSDLFADPAWDMLLDLYAADIERGEVSVTSLCCAACVPQTTALRWVGRLMDSGLVQREADPFDQRRSLTSITSSARALMHEYFKVVSSTRLFSVAEPRP